MDQPELTETDRAHLQRCVELAEQALAAGDEPFGSVLAATDGTWLHEDRNQVVTAADPTRHPEFTLARWAAQHLSAQDRASATVFTSGEHCPMCSAAHGWVGLARIVYVHSAAQLSAWLTELGVPPAPVQPLPVQHVAPGIPVLGPVAELTAQMRDLHRRFHRRA